jgi:hypothetical protein
MPACPPGLSPPGTRFRSRPCCRTGGAACSHRASLNNRAGYDGPGQQARADLCLAAPTTRRAQPAAAGSPHPEPGPGSSTVRSAQITQRRPTVRYPARLGHVLGTAACASRLPAKPSRAGHDRLEPGVRRSAVISASKIMTGSAQPVRRSGRPLPQPTAKITLHYV